jgi:RNA polymerase sigma-70 factor (ECF subfamily)
MNESLASVLFDACPGMARDPSHAQDDEAALIETIAAARATFPGLSPDDASYVRHLGPRLDASRPLREALRALHTDDLLLACACSAGDRHAILTFEEQCVRSATTALRKRGISPEIVEEAKQNIREKMLVGDGSPRILLYDGVGALREWLRVALVREAVHLSKREGRNEPLTYELFTVPAAGDTPELSYFKRRYRKEYKEAFTVAIAGLDANERLLLRQQLILGMSIDELGAIHRVHRATAARWVSAAREKLLSGARRELVKRLGIAEAEVQAVVRMIESQLDVSLGRLLAASRRGSPER